jgi:hypothetical protein
MVRFLPQAQINVRPQPINFRPAANGLSQLADSFRENRQRENQQVIGRHVADGNLGHASQEAARQGNLDQSIALRGVQQRDEQQAQQSERRLALRAAGFAQHAIDRAQTPEQKSAAVQRLLSMHEDFGAELQRAGVDVNNPDQVSAFVQAEAAEFQDPAARELAQAKLGLVRAQTANAQRRLNAPAAGPTFGRSPVMLEGPNGGFHTLQVGSDGSSNLRPLPEGYRPARGTSTIDTGTGTLVIDKVTGQDVREIDKNLAGAEKQKIIGRQQGDIVANARKARGTMFSLEQQWKTVDDAIDTALSNIGAGTAGFVGSNTSIIPGTPAYDLARTLETIKSNIGFDKLQDMRNNSPTGGALGQVSEFENRLLQSVRNSLEQGQSPDQLRQNLTLVKRDLAALQEERRRAYALDYGNVGQGQEQAPQQGSQAGQRLRFNPQTGAIE